MTSMSLAYRLERLWEGCHKGWQSTGQVTCSPWLRPRGLLTRTRASMTSLQICRLVALVTSKNRSEVVFLILKRVWEEFRE